MTRRRWNQLDGEPLRERPRRVAKGPLFYRKKVIRDLAGRVRVHLERPARPFRNLWPRDLLDTTDLMRYFRCSWPTLERCIYERGLRPAGRVGRELLFTKAAVQAWLKAHPWPGREGQPDESEAVGKERKEVSAMPSKQELLEENEELRKAVTELHGQIAEVLDEEGEDLPDEVEKVLALFQEEAAAILDLDEEEE